MTSEENLFRRHRLYDLIVSYPALLSKAVEGIPRERILSISVNDLVDEIVAPLRLDVPTLRRNEAYQLPPKDTEIEAPYERSLYLRETDDAQFRTGTLYTLIVPFDGDKDLFSLQPSTFFSTGVRAAIRDHALELYHPRSDHNVDAVRGDFEGRMAQIDSSLATQRTDVHAWNLGLPEKARSLIETRRKRVLDSLNLTEALGYPLKRREGVLDPVPLTRKRILSPAHEPANYEPEPELEMKAYEEILQMISSLSLMMERSPSAFGSMGEEQIRDIILVILNAQFEGRATGETFNRNGKTDILIRERNRNVFIAECKVWDGPKSLSGAIDQILSYACWRDTKVAILVFNHRRDISTVLDATPGTVAAHACFKKQLPDKQEHRFRFLFRQKDDPKREVTLSILVFDVPSPDPSAATTTKGMHSARTKEKKAT